MPNKLPVGLNKILLALAVFLACIGIFFGLFGFRQPKPTTEVTKLPLAEVDYTSEMDNSVQTAFADPLYHGVTDYLDLALGEKNLETQYNYYVKAYSQMRQIYNQDRRPEQLRALYLLREYLKPFPRFQDKDVAID